MQGRIDKAYLDKIDGKISEEFWTNHTKNWVDEKENLLIKLVATEKADSHYLENANIILELAKKISQLFKRQNAEQKRRLINLPVPNSYKDNNLDVEPKPVFNEIMKTSKRRNWCHLVGTFRNGEIEFSFNLSHIQLIFQALDKQLSL